MKNAKEYKCEICVKTYSSYKTLWAHRRKFHDELKNKVGLCNTSPPLPDVRFSCKNCKKNYKHVQTKNKHEKSCVYVPPISAELELEKAKQETIRLKIELQKMKGVDEKTIKSINKLLKGRTATNITNITNNNTQNITINVPSILGIGSEDVLNMLSREEKISIIEANRSSLDKIVEIVHCGKYDACKNIIITNLNTDYGYIFDEEKKCFMSANKSDILQKLYLARLNDLTLINNAAQKEKSANEFKIHRVKVFINELKNSTEPITNEITSKIYGNLKYSKINDIKLLLYNNRDSIIEDISAFVGEDDPIKAITQSIG